MPGKNAEKGAAPPSSPKSPLTPAEWASFLQSYASHLASVVEGARSRLIGIVSASLGVFATFAFLNLWLLLPLGIAFLTFLLALGTRWYRRNVPSIRAVAWWYAGLLPVILVISIALGMVVGRIDPSSWTANVQVLVVFTIILLWVFAWGFFSYGTQVLTLQPIAAAVDRYAWGVAEGKASDLQEVVERVGAILEQYWLDQVRMNLRATRTLLGTEAGLLARLPEGERDALLDSWILRKHGNLPFSEYVEIHRKTSGGGKVP